MRKNFFNFSQPYLYPNNNSIDLLCCFSEDILIDTFGEHRYPIRPWKIHLIKDVENNDEAIRLKLPEYIPNYGKVILECNPCVYPNNNILTYTCGIKENDKSAILYYMVSISYDDIIGKYNDIKIVSKTFNGVLHQNNIYKISKYLDNECIEIIDIDTNQILKTLKLNEEINRITKIFDSNDFIVTTSIDRDKKQSIIIDKDLNIIKKLENTYKCSIYRNYFAHTILHNSSEIESRSLEVIKSSNM